MLSRMVAYRRQQANEDRRSSHVEKGVVMGLIVAVIKAGDNATETGVFCIMLWNVKLWILDLEAGLDKSLGDAGEDEEE